MKMFYEEMLMVYFAEHEHDVAETSRFFCKEKEKMKTADEMFLTLCVNTLME